MPLKPVEGALKVFLLSRDVGFAYAGIPTAALDSLVAWNCLDEQRKASIDALTPLLVENSRAGDTDFIAFSMHPAYRLCRISHGSLEEGSPQYWIGDQNAFSEYQTAFHALMARVPVVHRQNPDWFENQMEPAMQEVIESSMVSTVGDFMVPVMSDFGGLRYSAYARLSLYPSTDVGPDGWMRLRQGSAAEGSSSINMLYPSSGVPAVAFYFTEGRFGILFVPAKLARPAILKADDVRAFSRMVEVEHGIKLEGQCTVVRRLP